MHTPYNRRTTGSGLTAANYPGKALQLVKYGYAVAVADFRGCTPLSAATPATTAASGRMPRAFDAYDITEWLARQPWSNGKVGMWGCSATGRQPDAGVEHGAAQPEGHLPDELRMGRVRLRGGRRHHAARCAHDDDARRFRARSATAMPWVSMATREESCSPPPSANNAHNLETPGIVPFRDSRSADFGSAWWLESSPHSYVETINKSGIAVYAAVNWAEGFTGHGPAYTFNNLRTPKKLILGPGKHCDWATVLTDTGFDIVTEELRFFDYWLRGIDNGVMREPAGDLLHLQRTAGARLEDVGRVAAARAAHRLLSG
jgi:predicted acyl esterase